MKKYELKDYKKFCDEVLVAPPCEEFDDGIIDEVAWYETHKVKIIIGDNKIELPYDADVVNELDYTLREIYEAIEGDGEATTGNTVGSEYRPATLKDLVKVAVREEFWHCGSVKDFGEYIRWFVRKHKSIGDILHCYEYICKDIKDYTETYKCNFSKLNMDNMINVNSDTIKRIIDELIGADRELLYGITDDNKSSDIVFVMDYTLKESGELIGWFYGQDNIDEEYINGLIEDYKNKLFAEEN
jgi:hypothetical protein